MCSVIPAKKAIVDPDDQIGVSKIIPNACAIMGSGIDYMKSYIPDNGEYEWAGETSDICHFASASQPDSMNCTFGCDWSGHCAIIGHPGTYKRVSYKADPVQCCLKGEKMIGNLTCDPKYRDPKSRDCYSAIKTYCETEDNMFTKDLCNTWCSNNSTECKEFKSKFCNNPATYNHPACKSWCMQNMGSCDDGMKYYCNNNPTDTSCACINSDLVKYKYNPLCQDKACIDNGYQTTSMITARGQGCEIIDCSTYLNAKTDGKVTFTDVNIEQRCGAQKTSGTSESGSTSKASVTYKSSFFKRNLYWILSLAFFIIIIIISGVFLVYR